MLRNVDTLLGSALGASDGEIGKVGDLYFDDQGWAVRYLVVQTGGLFKNRKVLITPWRVSRVDAERRVLEADLTQAEVAASPDAESDKPLSECMEILYYPHHFWPPSYEDERCGDDADVHLRSMDEVRRYAVAATDGDIGHVAGFVVDDSDWMVRYLIVDTRTLWPGKHVLVSQQWIEEADWNADRLRVNLTRAAIKESPAYDTHAAVTREYETDLCRFYNREGYWTQEPCADDESGADQGTG